MSIERGLVLFRQRRFDLAADQFRAALTHQPDLAQGHAFLALCLLELDALQDATAEGQQAVALSPNLPVAHAVLARVYAKRNHYKLAEQSSLNAIALDPYEPDHHGLLGAIRLDRRNWVGALQAADAALAADPEHVQGNNVRAMALVHLERRSEAGRTIATTLAHDPENAFTYANHGWALLHGNEPGKAMEHFREALRLDPEMDWARQGIVEAMKAKNPLYRVMLLYFLWTSRRSGAFMWALLLCAWIVVNLMVRVTKAHPELRPSLYPIIYTYVAFVLLSWLSYPLFNLLLRTHRFGRLALSRQQIIASNWVGGILLTALVLWVIGTIIQDGRLSVGSIGMLLMAIPVAGVFYCSIGWPRTVIAIYAVALAAIGFVVHALGENRDGELFLSPSLVALDNVFIGGLFVGSILIQALGVTRPKR